MKIVSQILNKKVNFKGLEAQPLQAIYVQGDSLLGGITLYEELNAIAQKHKIHVMRSSYCTPWVQDGVTFTPDGRVLSANERAGEFFSRRHNLQYDKKSEPNDEKKLHHISGGNLFFVTNKDGKRVALTAEEYDKTCKIRGMEEFYNVDKIIELPRADFHVDLFLTPIGDNKIFVADDNMTLHYMMVMIEKITEYIENNPDDKDNEYLKEVAKNIFNEMMRFFESKKSYMVDGGYDAAADILSKEGFEVIRVPSVVYESFEDANNKKTRIKHKLNYSNAITYKNDDNEVIYITGKSELGKQLGIDEIFNKKIGMNFEKMFTEAIYPYVKPENIYFVNGDKYRPVSEMLYDYLGGLHCMCAEVPKID